MYLTKSFLRWLGNDFFARNSHAIISVKKANFREIGTKIGNAEILAQQQQGYD